MLEQDKPLPYHLVESWFQQHQRDLPWRQNRSPYHVWLSEIMLQQTQVSVVVHYFNRFVNTFGTLKELSEASEDAVLGLWSGLGYYSRGRNLHKTAQIIMQKHNGLFPDDYETLLSLPGVGSYTAGAILTFAFQKPAAVVDGNIARVLARLFHDPTPINSPAGKKHFEAISLRLVKNATSVSFWQEGLMEIGAVLCKTQNPLCFKCPLQNHCQANRLNNTSLIPQKIQIKKRQSRNLVCAIIYNEKEIWLEKNIGTNLLKGLYAPPNIIFENESEMHDKLSQILKSRNLPFSSQTLTPILVKRTLTHLNLNLFGFLIFCDSQQNSSSCWIKREEIHQIGLSTAIRALLASSLDKTGDLL